MDRIYIAWEAELICKATSSVKTRLSGDVLPKVTILSQQPWKLSAWEMATCKIDNQEHVGTDLELSLADKSTKTLRR